jgi:hypothetical protein
MELNNVSVSTTLIGKAIILEVLLILLLLFAVVSTFEA